MAAVKKCEITNALSDLSSDSSSEGSDYEDILSSSQSVSQNSSKSTEKQQKSVQRLPTRRPDPNVFNRNALLARENRRKKKAYVEALEKELDEMKFTNKKLHKLLRKHMKMVKKLEHEKQYYKGLISNQSDILNLVSVLNTKVPPQGLVFPPKASSCSPTDSNRSTSSLEQLTASYDFNDTGTGEHIDDAFFLDGLINDFNFSTDSNYEPYSETSWDQLLCMDDAILPQEDSGYCPTNNGCEAQSAHIGGEHNYFTNQDSIMKGDADSGLCLHIARGKISIECCPTCHLNAKRSSALPEQLLVVD